MFQYVWYDKNKFTGRTIMPLPSEYISFDDVERINNIYWCEHCTECAVPLCYNNCANWEARIDKKCRRFAYGIKKSPAKNSFAATVELKKWGKIESIYFDRALTPSQANVLDKTNFYISNILKGISKLLRLISPTLKISGFFEFIKDKSFAKIGKKEKPSCFLVSCFLHNENPCSLFFEMYNKNTVFVRQTLELKHGFNQIVIDLETYSQQLDNVARVRIFGAEDTTCEATFYFLDFVKLKASGKIKLLPKDNKPAEKVKCVVWDLDNTMWNGILIEADPQTLKLREGVLETIQWLDNRGIIQGIASKNDEQNAVAVLKRLGIYDYFVCQRINWMPKSLNINEMAKELNINVNTFAFVDDSVHERSELSENIPAVRVYKETDIVDFATLPEFDVPITEDSKNRRNLYLINRSRNDYKAKLNLNHFDFLRQCELIADISHIENAEQKKRSYELLLRTNQLNLSGKRYEEEEFESYVSQNDKNIYILSLKDKFGTYGQSMFLYVQADDKSININEFALSCRIAGKYVESAVMKWLTEKYGNKDIVLIGKNNKKNALLINTLKQIGFDQIEQEDQGDLVLRHSQQADFENSDIVNVNDAT